jgi:hypothetical protein
MSCCGRMDYSNPGSTDHGNQANFTHVSTVALIIDLCPIVNLDDTRKDYESTLLLMATLFAGMKVISGWCLFVVFLYNSSLAGTLKLSWKRNDFE